jgi:hypothetical protein
MEMHQIRYFLAVSEYLNFRQAGTSVDPDSETMNAPSPLAAGE